MEYYLLPILFFVIAILIWRFALRSPLLKYFKIDEVLAELRKQNETLAKINAHLERSSLPPG